MLTPSKLTVCTAKLEWELTHQTVTEAEAPPSLVGAGACSLNAHLYVLCGLSSCSGWTNDVYVFESGILLHFIIYLTVIAKKDLVGAS